MAGGELAFSIQRLTEQLTHFSLNDLSNDIQVLSVGIYQNLTIGSNLLKKGALIT